VADRLIDRVLDPHYIDGLDDIDRATLEQRIAEATEVEAEVSAVRRRLHRVINVLQTELAARP
jgi:hypothetical protein